MLDLVKQKRFYPYEYIRDFEKFREVLPRKERFYCSLTEWKISDNKYQNGLNDWKKFEMKNMKDYYDLHLKCDF